MEYFHTFYIFVFLLMATRLTYSLDLQCEWKTPFVCSLESNVADFSVITELTITLPFYSNGPQGNTIIFEKIDDFRKTFPNVSDVKLYHVTDSILESDLFRQFHYVPNINMSHCSLTRVLKTLFNFGNTFQSIDLSFNGMWVMGDYIFRGCEMLKTIYLHNNSLTNIREKAFSGVPTIEEIFLNSNLIKQIDEKSFDIPGLKRLHLQDNRLVSLADGLFSKAPKYLDLSSNQLTNIGGAFDHATNLINLNLSNNNDLKTVSLNALSELYNLNELSLNETGFYFKKRSDTDISFGPYKRRKSSVKHLNLKNDNFVFDHFYLEDHEEDAYETLDALSSLFPNLETLHFNVDLSESSDKYRIRQMFKKLKKFHGRNYVYDPNH